METGRNTEQPFDGEGLIEGRNAVIEALRAGTAIDKIYLQKGDAAKSLGFIASTARKAGIVVVDADRRKLDAMSRTGAHQGVVAVAAAQSYADVDDLLTAAAERKEAPLLVALDGVSDPHNLGAVIRAAECAGAHGVIIPKRRSAGLTAVTAKASAGAVSWLKVARVPNLPAALNALKERGLWIYGAAAEGAAPLYGTDWTGPAVVVIGSEGAGLTRLVRETCDALVSIPLRGHVNSLNASVAAAVILYEAVRQRTGGR